MWGSFLPHAQLSTVNYQLSTINSYRFFFPYSFHSLS